MRYLGLHRAIFPWPVGNAAGRQGGVTALCGSPSRFCHQNCLKCWASHSCSTVGATWALMLQEKNSLHTDFPPGHGGLGWLLHRMGVTHLRFSSGPQGLRFASDVLKTSDPSLAILTQHLISPINSLSSWRLLTGGFWKKPVKNLAVLSPSFPCRNQVGVCKNAGV